MIRDLSAVPLIPGAALSARCTGRDPDYCLDAPPGMIWSATGTHARCHRAQPRRRGA